MKPIDSFFSYLLRGLDKLDTSDYFNIFEIRTDKIRKKK